MRTITTRLKKNLEEQKKEAEILGLTKVATQVSNQLSNQEVRDLSEEYVYKISELKEDVEFLFHKAALRIQDYYNYGLDQKDLENKIAYFVDSFISEISPRDPIVGPYEPIVPGEQKEETEFEIE